VFTVGVSRSGARPLYDTGTADLWQRLRQPGPLAGRALLLVVGCVLATVCYAVTIQASLGLGPLFVVQVGLAQVMGISIGTAVMVTGVTTILVAVLLRSWPGPGTLALPFMSGALLNLMLPAIPTIHGLAFRALSVVVATWIMALGGALMIRAGLGPMAYDCVMLGLHRVSGWSVAPVRLAMELSMLLLGWLLGGPIGVGTAVTAVLIGPGLHFWLRLLSRPERVSRAVPVGLSNPGEASTG